MGQVGILRMNQTSKEELSLKIVVDVVRLSQRMNLDDVDKRVNIDGTSSNDGLEGIEWQG